MPSQTTKNNDNTSMANPNPRARGFGQQKLEHSYYLAQRGSTISTDIHCEAKEGEKKRNGKGQM